MKRWLAAGLVAMLGGVALAAGLPQRNLVVEWRVVERVDAGVPAGDGVTVGTARSVDARGASTLRTARADAPVHRAVVMNGQAVQLESVETVTWHWAEAASTPRGPVGVLRSAPVETGRAIALQPRWAGGHADVELVVEHAGTTLPDDPASGPRRERVRTTLRVPLGVWATLADSTSASGPGVAGTVSTRDVASHRQQVLQVRVSAP